MNIPHPQTMVRLATRNRLQFAGDTMKPDKLADDLVEYAHMKELAPIRHYEGWQ
jgi:hypothetical protein